MNPFNSNILCNQTPGAQADFST